jgi:hypothetical protein
MYSGIPGLVQNLKAISVTANEHHHRPPDVNPISPEDGFLAVLLAEAACWPPSDQQAGRPAVQGNLKKKWMGPVSMI